jgi:hypothetical protein
VRCLTRYADPAGNERLTAMTGAVLLGLFAAECLTREALARAVGCGAYVGRVAAWILAVCAGSGRIGSRFRPGAGGFGGCRAGRREP